MVPISTDARHFLDVFTCDIRREGSKLWEI